MGHRTLLCLLASAFFCACATAPPSEPKFVTREALEQMLTDLGPAPAAPRFAPGVVVAEWQLAGPQPELLGGTVVAPSTPLEEGVARRPQAGVLNDAEICVARETLRFVAAHRSIPAEALAEHIAGWCGAIGEWRAFTWRTTGPDAAMHEWIAGALRDDGEAGRIGVWSDPDSGLSMLVQSRVSVELEPIPLVADRRLVEVRGTVLPEQQKRFEDVGALITAGPYDANYCNSDPSVQYPSFSFQCALRDDAASIALSMDLLDSSEVAETLVTAAVFRRPPGLHYRARPVPPMRAPRDPADAVRVLGETINALRAEAGRAPMQIADRQSALLVRAAPHLAAALEARDFKVADPLIAGIRAGWEVEGDIISSHWSRRWVARGDQADMMTQLWNSPGARRVLFSPEARSFAASVRWVGKDQRTAEIFLISYEHLPDEHYNRRVGRVLAQIDELRAGYGNPPARRLVAMRDDLKAIADRVTAGELTAEQGLRRVRELGYQHSGGGRWWSAQRYARDLTKIDLNPQLLRRKRLDVNVAVAVERRRDRPYARYVVYFFWFD